MLIRPLRATKRALRAGFTLIELLAVIAIIAILAVFLLPQIPAAFDAANVTACKSNMNEIYKGLIIYKSRLNRVPPEPGVRFFTSLITDKIWENSASNAKRMTCPGVEISFLMDLNGLEPIDWYADKEVISGASSSYAGRNVREFPFKKWPPRAAQILVADDNEGGEGNHATSTVVLRGDGSREAIEVVLEQEKGNLAPDETYIPVGPGSPIEELTKLSLN
jgi:prepilin-type N-terminal cleavage/methylation domain-containing protein